MQSGFDNLHRFVANNYDLEKLEAQLNSFNPLRVLRIEHYEIRHSNILSWLLDPNGNHNLGDTFLKKFLSEVIINNENLETDLTVFDIQDMQLYDSIVAREWNNIDILLSSAVAKTVVLIENKLNARESKGQLKKYYDLVTDSYKNFDLIPILISLEESRPSDERYGVISHSQILSMLRFVSTIQRDNLNPRVYDFILYYLKTLELLTMEDKEIKSLCKKIYREHKEALDLIYDYADETEFEDASREFLESISAEELSVDGGSAWFIPSEFRGKFELIGEEYWCSGYPFAFWYTRYDEKLGIILEIGPFKNGEKRRAFLSHLKKHDFKIHEKSFKPGAKYTRIFTKYPRFDDWDNKESIIEKMDDLYRIQAKNAKTNLLKACTTFSWKDT